MLELKSQQESSVWDASLRKTSKVNLYVNEGRKINKPPITNTKVLP